METLIELKTILQTEAGMYSLVEMLSVLAISTLGGWVVYWTYGSTSEGVFYYRGFHLSLVFIPLMVSVIILSVSSNIAISLGVLGALSIVRYRTPIKDPLDLIYIFWAIALGIASGARLFLLCMISTALIAGGLMLVSRTIRGSGASRGSGHLLIVRFPLTDSVPETRQLEEGIERLVRRAELRHRMENEDHVEVVMEITFEPGNEQRILDTVQALGAKTTTLISAQGNMISY